jgi:hypothetical protein
MGRDISPAQADILCSLRNGAIIRRDYVAHRYRLYTDAKPGPVVQDRTLDVLLKRGYVTGMGQEFGISDRGKMALDLYNMKRTGKA